MKMVIPLKDWVLPIGIGLCLYLLDMVLKSGLTILNLSIHFKNAYPEGFDIKLKGLEIYLNNELYSLDVLSIPNFEWILFVSAVLILFLGYAVITNTIGLKYLEVDFPSLNSLVIAITAAGIFIGSFYFLQKHIVGLQSGFIDSRTLENKSFFIFLMAIGILIPLVEELIFRGLIQRAISARFGYVVGIVLASLFFTILHFQYSWPLLIGVLILGVLFGVLKQYFGSIWPSVLAHIMINTTGLFLLT